MIRTNISKIVVDAGLSGKKIWDALEKIEAKKEKIDAVLISHDHSDHVKGAGIVCRKLDIPLYISRLTYESCLHKLGKLPAGVVHFSVGKPLQIGDIKIETIPSKHDGMDGANFVFITNGTLLTKEIIKRLTRFNYLWFQISIDSAYPERHDQLRGIKGTWEKAVKNAVKISQQNIPLKIASCITPEELPYMGKLVELSIAVGASCLILGDIMPSGRAFINNSLLLSNNQKKELYLNIKKLQKTYHEKIKIETMFSLKTQLRYASIGNIEGCIIRPNGDVRLDCVAPFIVGNIRKENFHKIWQKIQPTPWTHNNVVKFIESIDYVSGFSNMINNYLEEDLLLTI